MQRTVKCSELRREGGRGQSAQRDKPLDGREAPSISLSIYSGDVTLLSCHQRQSILSGTNYMKIMGQSECRMEKFENLDVSGRPTI